MRCIMVGSQANIIDFDMGHVAYIQLATESCLVATSLAPAVCTCCYLRLPGAL